MEEKRRLTVGIIGGMGPEATLDLFGKILRLTPASCDEEHLNLQIDNNPLPGAKREPLCERARRLETCGVDFIAMPCNAAHAFHADVQASVNIPVVNMVREAVKTVINTDPTIERVGVLAWHETLTAGLYQDMLEQFGLRPVIPEAAQWSKITALVNTIKSGKNADVQRTPVRDLGNLLIERGAQAIILGCTELPLVLSQDDFPVPVVDATYVLAQNVVALAMGIKTFTEL